MISQFFYLKKKAEKPIFFSDEISRINYPTPNKYISNIFEGENTHLQTTNRADYGNYLEKQRVQNEKKTEKMLVPPKITKSKKNFNLIK